MRKCLTVVLVLLGGVGSSLEAQIPLPFFKKKKKEPPPAEAAAKPPGEIAAPGAPAPPPPAAPGAAAPTTGPETAIVAQPQTPAPAGQAAGRTPEDQAAIDRAIQEALQADLNPDTSVAGLNARVTRWTSVLFMLAPADPQYQTAQGQKQAALDALKAAQDRAAQAGNASKQVQDLVRGWLAQARVDMASKNFGAADANLAKVREQQPTHPDLPTLEAELARARRVDDIRRRLLIFTPILAVLGAALVFGFRGVVKWRESRQQKIDAIAAKRQAVIQVVDGIGRGKLVTIDKEKAIFKIGAALGGAEAEQNDLVISDSAKTVSRFHCTLVRKDGEYFLVDASVNGTSVNGDSVKRGEHYRLDDGDEISIAEAARLKFLHT